MKAATVHELKKELVMQDPSRLLEICLRLAKFKKDNKELMTYMLFESDDEEQYIASVERAIDEMLESMNRSSIFFIKKTIRKTVRHIDKYIRYSGKKETEVDIRIYLCECIKEQKIPIKRSRVLTNMYNSQLKKINAAMTKIHEDLQYDYQSRLDEIL